MSFFDKKKNKKQKNKDTQEAKSEGENADTFIVSDPV
jgi:hypothetical protein